MRNLLAISYAKRTLEPGSREQQRMELLAQELDRYVMIVFTRQSDNLPTEYHSGNLSIYGTAAKTKLGVLWQALRVGRTILRDKRISWVVSSQNPFEASLIGYPLSWAANAKHHVQIHGDNFSNPHWLRMSSLNQLREWFGWFVLRRAIRIRVVSQRIKDALLAGGILDEHIDVLPVQIEIDTFLEVGRNRSKEATNATLTFLYVGRFEAEKDVDRIITAFAAVYKTNPHIRLHLVGAGQQASYLEQCIADTGLSDVCTITPWTNDVPGVMAAADVFLLASWHEGFALVLLEAMAAGLPIVTTDVGCVGDVVQNNQHGLVVPIGDSEQFAAAITALATDAAKRQAFSTTGHQRAKQIAEQYRDYGAVWKASFFPDQNSYNR